MRLGKGKLEFKGLKPPGACVLSPAAGRRPELKQSLREGRPAQPAAASSVGTENTPGRRGPHTSPALSVDPPCFSLTPNLDSALLSFIVSSLTLQKRPIPTDRFLYLHL